MKPIQLGFMDNGTGKHQSNTVWHIGAVCPCISTLGSGKTCGGTQQITPNNFRHKSGDGPSTRKRNVSYIHPALQANCGATQCTYLLVRITYGNGEDKTSN